MLGTKFVSMEFGIIWYNIDLTVYANGQNIRNLLQDDQNFVAHSPYSENKKEPCLLQYPRERILYFLERMKSYPNFFVEYEKGLNDDKPKQI